MSRENASFRAAGGQGGGGEDGETSNSVSPPEGGTIHDDNASCSTAPRVISPAGVPGDAEELPNGDLPRSLFSVGVPRGDDVEVVPGGLAGGVSGAVAYRGDLTINKGYDDDDDDCG